MTIPPFDFQNIQASDLKNIEVNIDTENTSYGRHFTVQNGDNSPGSAVFHDVYSETRQLTKRALKDNNIDDLQALRTFIGKLRTAENAGIDYYNSKGCGYHFATAFHRFFGKTPFFGTHLSRLDSLERKINKKLAPPEDAPPITDPETKKAWVTEVPQSWIDKLVRPPKLGVDVDIIANSKKFQEEIRPLPIKTNSAEVLGGDPEMAKEIAAHAKSAHSFVDARVETLASDFLKDKLKNGTDEEKTLYKDMTPEQFFERLLTKRPLVFYYDTDQYMLRHKNHQDKNIEGSDTGKDELGATVGGSYLENAKLEDYISYDEMQISAYLNTATPTHFINNGSKFNSGKPGEEGTFEASGIFYGMVGARFEKQGRMEEEFLIIRPERNFSSEKREMWEKFFGLTLPSHEDAKADYEADPKNSRFLKVGDYYLDKALYKSMMERRISGYLKDADSQAQAQGKKAYLHIVGLGLGVWSSWQGISLAKDLGEIQKNIYVELIQENQFQNIGTVNFSWFPEGLEFPASLSVNGQDIPVLSNKRNVADKLENGQLLCAMYAWDSNSFPGNEFWRGALANSMDPAAACCSMIPELQNPEINENVKNLYAYK